MCVFGGGWGGGNPMLNMALREECIDFFSFRLTKVAYSKSTPHGPRGPPIQLWNAFLKSNIGRCRLSGLCEKKSLPSKYHLFLSPNKRFIGEATVGIRALPPNSAHSLLGRL